MNEESPTTDSKTTSWNAELEIGVQPIDHHHQELFHLTQLIDAAIGDPAKIDQIIRFLEDYVQSHFAEEEDLMKNKNFSGYDEHKAEHEGFKTIVSNIRTQYDQRAQTLLMPLRQFVDELVEHIRTVDVKLKQLK